MQVLAACSYFYDVIMLNAMPFSEILFKLYFGDFENRPM